MPESADRTPPAALAGFARTVSATTGSTSSPAATTAAVLDTARWAEWLPLHSMWSQEPPAEIVVGSEFGQHIKIMGIPTEVAWRVSALDAGSARWDGTGTVGVALSLFVEVVGTDTGSRVHLDLGLDGDTLNGPMGATVEHAVQEALDAAAADLGVVLGGRTARPDAPVRHERTGVELDPRTPVVVGVGQWVGRDPGRELLDPVALSAIALRRAAEDAGASSDLLAAADAVYAVASASWPYHDQAALVAHAVGATPAETVVTARFGGDGGQLAVNAAAEAVARGEAGIVLVTGAEAGATLAAAQKQGITPDWPEQGPDVAPTRVLGVDREASNDAESAAGLGRPVHVYALIESAVRGAAGTSVAEHDAAITGLWSRFSGVAAGNPYAWRPEQVSPERLASVDADNRMITTPYRKLLCANLQVDLATGLIVCSVAAAQAAGIDQDRWVFVHAGASAQDEWFVSERADLDASPAIRTIGAAALGHAGLAAEDVTYVDLYACFPSAVEIAAHELGLPVDDPDRPLTVTGGLTFGGGPGNNYGAHAIANVVPLLRADPDATGLTTSLGWFVTKHAIGIYSARPPQRAYRNLHPVVDLPPSRPVLRTYAGPGVVEAWTVAYGRDGAPDAAVLSVLTPAGARVLLRVTDRAAVDRVLAEDPLRSLVTVSGPDEFVVADPTRHPLPEPPAPPVRVERHGPVTVITLDRPEVRNAIDSRTALLLERAIDSFEADETARVAVLTGAGGSFSAGMDLKAAARGEFPFSERRGPLGLTGTPPTKPLIAAVEGPALAGGCELALAADLVVAASDSRFGLPEPKRGLVAAAGGVLRLAQRLPRAVALEFVLTGEPMDARRCAELGLVNRVVEPGTALAEALVLARTIAANAPMSVRIGKQIVDECGEWAADEAFDRQTELATPALVSHDAGEGVRAFAEHREPVWTGH